MASSGKFKDKNGWCFVHFGARFLFTFMNLQFTRDFHQFNGNLFQQWSLPISSYCKAVAGWSVQACMQFARGIQKNPFNIIY